MYGSLFYVLPILAVIAKTVFRAVLPLLIGCMIAYVVNILMCFYEKGYARICRSVREGLRGKQFFAITARMGNT